MKFYGFQIFFGITMLMAGILEGRSGTAYNVITAFFIMFSLLNMYNEVFSGNHDTKQVKPKKNK